MRIDAIPPQAIELVKSFEDLRLASYRCPSGVLTIGFGQTGSWVKPELTITEKQAALYLYESLISVAHSIPDEIWDKLNTNQRAALISFLYNVGTGALQGKTFSQAINYKLTEVPQRLLDWDKAIVNGVKRPVKGLTRRRRAEAILWVTGKVIVDELILDDWQQVKNLISSAPTEKPISLLNVVKHYKDLPHQNKALEWLDSCLSDNVRSEFASLYRALPEPVSRSSLPEKFAPRLVFDMPLGDQATRNIIIGVLTLKGWKTEQDWQCTSGQPGYQYSGGTKLKGKGPLPGHRYVKTPEGNNVESYQVNLSPYNLKHVKGIEGNAFHILPDPIYIGRVMRSELMIHNDSNRLYSPGSAGCIVTMTTKEFSQIEQAFKELRQAGYNQIPLEVNH
jgi:GH24 family phage-related lysozyme (muramidase)